ncbi:related to kinesin light chain [Serendipita indica DSM 11827]|uniref:Related to kinesin light chain n=1 Tax=Serendipita indica (strain DSM 11827) TaxID=1109443 RepID=G4TJL5_SERID|nr:related to kinesin light chain [Serendipita indica DSM 11827]
MAGGGKTQLASSWIRTNKTNFTRVIVVDGSSQQRIEADLERSIREIGPQYSKSTWKDAIAYLDGKDTGWLLFLDNVDTLNLPLAQYLPNSTHGSILMTTRNSEYCACAPRAHKEVGELTEEQALELLHCVAEISPSSSDISLAIVKKLGMWALAITHAGAYIFNGGSLNTYLDTFSKHEGEIMRQDVLKERNYLLPTYTAFDLSFQQLPEKSQEFMKLVAFLHYTSIPQELFQRSTTAGFCAHIVMEGQASPDRDKQIILYLTELLGSEWNEVAFQDIVNSVCRASFLHISRDDAGNIFYGLHTLLQAYIRDLVNNCQDHYALAAEQLLLGAIRPLSEQESNAWYWHLVPHISALPAVKRPKNIAHALAFDMVHRTVGSWNASRETLEHCLPQLSQALGPQHPNTIWVMRQLGHALRECGQWEEATNIQQKVVELQITSLGQKHPDTIKAMGDLAWTTHKLGKLEEAEKMGREVLSLQQEVLGQQNPDTIQTMHNLAATMQALDKLDEAEEMQRVVLDVRRQTLGPKHSDTVWAMSNLALTYLIRGRLEEAESMQRQVLELRLEILGRRHPQTPLAMNNLAQTLTSRGLLEEAEKMRRESVKLRIDILGRQHPATLRGMHGLGMTLQCCGSWEEAEGLLQEVLDVQERILGHRHLDTISTMHSLAGVMRQRGKLGYAEELGRELLKLRQDILGPRHQDTIQAARELITTLELCGQTEEAQKLSHRWFRL